VAAVASATFVLAACGNGSGGGGDEALALGEEAVVEYTETGEGGAPGATTTLGVTALRVRQGTQEELSQGGLEVDPEDRSSTPYYVDVRYENQGPNEVTRNLDISLEDSDGNSLPTTLIFDFGGEPYEPCPRVTEGTLAPGENYESCTLTLVPEGADVARVLFVSQRANAEIVFTYWDAE
jgi:hypothetical protein